MSSRDERSAADLGYTGPAHAVATVASSTRLAIPDAWDDRFVDFCAEGLDVWVRFGGSTVAVSKTAVSTVAAEAMTEDATTAHLHIPAGTSKPVLIRKNKAMTCTGTPNQTHLAHISTGTTGYLRMVLSTGPGES